MLVTSHGSEQLQDALIEYRTLCIRMKRCKYLSILQYKHLAGVAGTEGIVCDHQNRRIALLVDFLQAA